MKICSRCKIEKELDDFHKNTSSKDGHVGMCKKCVSEKSKKYYTDNKDSIDKKANDYRKSNKEKVRESKRKHNFKYKKYYSDKAKQRYILNRESILKRVKQYSIDNKESVRKYHAKYERDRKKTDAGFKITKIIRRRLQHAVKDYSLTKQYSTIDYLGCDQRTLLEWLQWSGERYDKDFDINNYDSSQYHIDHIKTFADVSKGIYTIEEVAHYTNLQILTVEENLRKSGESWIE